MHLCTSKGPTERYPSYRASLQNSEGVAFSSAKVLWRAERSPTLDPQHSLTPMSSSHRSYHGCIIPLRLAHMRLYNERLLDMKYVFLVFVTRSVRCVIFCWHRLAIRAAITHMIQHYVCSCQCSITYLKLASFELGEPYVVT